MKNMSKLWDFSGYMVTLTVFIISGVNMKCVWFVTSVARTKLRSLITVIKYDSDESYNHSLVQLAYKESQWKLLRNQHHFPAISSLYHYTYKDCSFESVLNTQT